MKPLTEQYIEKLEEYIEFLEYYAFGLKICEKEEKNKLLSELTSLKKQIKERRPSQMVKKILKNCRRQWFKTEDFEDIPMLYESEVIEAIQNYLNQTNKQ